MVQACRGLRIPLIYSLVDYPITVIFQMTRQGGVCLDSSIQLMLHLFTTLRHDFQFSHESASPTGHGRCDDYDFVILYEGYGLRFI